MEIVNIFGGLYKKRKETGISFNGFSDYGVGGFLCVNRTVYATNERRDGNRDCSNFICGSFVFFLPEKR